MSEGMFCWFTENAQNISLHSIYYNDIALCCINSVTILLNVFASGLVVYKYYQTRARQPVSNTLLFLLVSLDLAKSCVGQSLFISMFILEFVGIFYCTLQNINETVLHVCLFGIQFYYGDNCFNVRTIFCHRIPDLSPRLHAQESVNLSDFVIVCSMGNFVNDFLLNLTTDNSVV